MKNEMVLSAKDLNAVGINTQLTSNDLVEIVANDIYEKIILSLTDYIDRGKELQDRWSKLFDKDFEVIRTILIKNKYISDSDEIVTHFDYVGKYWNSSVYLTVPRLIDKDKGIKVDTSGHRLNYNSGSSIKIKLVASITEKETENNISINGIEGNIQSTTNKKFVKVLSISDARFQSMVREIKKYNSEVENCIRTLPKGTLSVERFTREARIKMNKKIISGQSTEFKQKMSQLFSIKL